MDFSELLQRRRTIRRFAQRPVADADLRALLEAARLASSAANLQPLRYVVARTPQLVAQLLPLTAWAARVQPRRNPVLGESAPWTQADAGAAIQSIEFAATDRGLGCCWLGAIQREPIAELLQLPPDRQLLYLVAVGYPDEQPVHEDAPSPDRLSYYLDENDRLHVPKLTADQNTVWK